MRLARGVMALAGLALLPFSAMADEPGPLPLEASRSRAVAQESYVAYPYLVPDCFDQAGQTLLKCAPRTYGTPDDIATLNALNAIPDRIRRPYPYLFSW